VNEEALAPLVAVASKNKQNSNNRGQLYVEFEEIL
jgi:hypothetical protein